MASDPTSGVLRQAALAHDDGEPPDGRLLQRFLDRRDEAAFALLLRRHGPMVLGVCRRLLGNEHDADDAFQAAFLVLVRKAASFRARRTVGDWLYGVAYHTALKARAASVKRRLKESQARPPAANDTADETADLLTLLDRELSRLPAKYREPVVLCELQGRGRREAARQLGLPEGTLSSRLATARKLLAKRLARYGLAVTGGTLAAVQAATASVPAALAAKTADAVTAGATGAAASLAEGVLKAMFLTKLKVLTALAVTLGLLAGGAAAWRYAAADEPGKDEPKKLAADKVTAYQVRFVGPAGAKIGRFGDDDKAAREVPCRLTFDQPGIYRLKLTNVPNRPGAEFYPTVEVCPATRETARFLTNAVIPVEFTEADFEKAEKSQLAIRAVCLHQDGQGTFAVTEPPTNGDVVDLAKKKGPILLVARLGAIDLEAKKPAEYDGYRAALIAALHHFAEKGELDHVKALLGKHPDLLDAKPIFRQPHKPSRGDDFTPLIVAVQEGREEVAAYLLSKGANVQADDWLQGWTPLHIAARRGDLNMAKLLLKHGAKLDAKDAGDRTPLDLATEEKRPEMVELLTGLRK
jgi:RNA polymerase sigma factor (sigma-70 family)